MLNENPTQNMRISGESFPPAALLFKHGRSVLDGTPAASSDTAKNTYFLKRIKQYLDQLK